MKHLPSKRDMQNIWKFTHQLQDVWKALSDGTKNRCNVVQAHSNRSLRRPATCEWRQVAPTATFCKNTQQTEDNKGQQQPNHTTWQPEITTTWPSLNIIQIKLWGKYILKNTDAQCTMIMQGVYARCIISLLCKHIGIIIANKFACNFVKFISLHYCSLLCYNVPSWSKYECLYTQYSSA